MEDFARPYRKGEGIAGWLESLPRILAGDALRGVVEALRRARDQKRAMLWGMGGHVVKCGLADILLDLMRRGWVTGVRHERRGFDSRFRDRHRRARPAKTWRRCCRTDASARPRRPAAR